MFINVYQSMKRNFFNYIHKFIMCNLILNKPILNT